jgi:hypothetical protein
MHNPTCEIRMKGLNLEDEQHGIGRIPVFSQKRGKGSARNCVRRSPLSRWVKSFKPSTLLWFLIVTIGRNPIASTDQMTRRSVIVPSYDRSGRRLTPPFRRDQGVHSRLKPERQQNLATINNLQEGEELDGRFPTLEGKCRGLPLTMLMFLLNNTTCSDVEYDCE